MRRRLPPTLAATVMLALCSPAAAPAQAPTEDSVVGTLQTTEEPPSPARRYVIDARSGPSGEDPRGTVQVYLSVGGVVVFSSPLSVSCLDVSGDRAVIVASISVGLTTIAAHLEVIDSPAGEPDRLADTIVDSGIPSCAPGVSGEPVPVGGSVTITDAQPFPTSTQQCKQGGFAGYGFRNQGQCVAFVNRGRPG